MKPHAENLIFGVNSFITEQRSVSSAGKCIVSIYKFSDEVSVVLERLDLGECPTLTEAHYKPNGFTALYDALGYALTRNAQDKNVVLVVVTDGAENSSSRYTRDQVRDLMRKVRPRGAGRAEGDSSDSNWSVVYLCETPNLESQGEGLGMVNNAKFGSSNISTPFKAIGRVISDNVGSAVSSYRSGKSSFVSVDSVSAEREPGQQASSGSVIQNLARKLFPSKSSAK